MLRARIGSLIIFGLEQENMERLAKGEPIMFDMHTLGIEGSVAIFAGGDKQDLVNTLMHKMGLKIPGMAGNVMEDRKDDDNQDDKT